MKTMDSFARPGWSREFGQPAARLRNGRRLQAPTRPARENHSHSFRYGADLQRHMADEDAFSCFEIYGLEYSL